MHQHHSTTLRQRGLKNTAARRLILEILKERNTALPPVRIQAELKRTGHPFGIVTIYRVTEALERARLIHRHDHDGSVSVCKIPDADGLHVLFHCEQCGDVQEAVREETLAKKFGFHPVVHATELPGICSLCRQH